MIRIICVDQNGVLNPSLALEDCVAKLAQPGHMIWVDIFDSPHEESRALMQNIFGFHPLAIDDALEETHIPKVDDWGDYLYMVTQLINPGDDQEISFETHELDIFIGKQYLLTYHLQENKTIDKVWDRTLKNHALNQIQPASLLYLLLDETASDFIINIDQLNLILNDLEDRIFRQADPSLLEEIFALKRSILDLRQSIGPQREVLNKLSRGDYPLLGEQSRMYFQDVYDHYMRLFDIIENLRDLADNALEIFLSVVNNRMSGIVKTLTIITSLFMPISFLVAFFGMNFFPPLQNFTGWMAESVFIAVLAAIILFPTTMLILYSRKGWIR